MSWRTFAICQPQLYGECFDGVIFTFNNENNSFNNSYSKINLPYYIRMCKIVTNHVNFFQAPKWNLDCIKVIMDSKFYLQNGFIFICNLSYRNSPKQPYQDY
jgi:hypothetical protein